MSGLHSGRHPLLAAGRPCGTTVKPPGPAATPGRPHPALGKVSQLLAPTRQPWTASGAGRRAPAHIRWRAAWPAQQLGSHRGTARGWREWPPHGRKGLGIQVPAPATPRPPHPQAGMPALLRHAVPHGPIARTLLNFAPPAATMSGPERHLGPSALPPEQHAAPRSPRLLQRAPGRGTTKPVRPVVLLPSAWSAWGEAEPNLQVLHAQPSNKRAPRHGRPHPCLPSQQIPSAPEQRHHVL
mmetsp:Transcript_67512/g.174879  ORF Transcript_67512/g.174879 Transcript_67512/m.174879 type:complete len:240 (+) Transcript_67512:703-1422(+)